MLLGALHTDDSDYCVLLRWVCCGAFAYLAFQALSLEKKGWIWVLGITALFYNPIITVHLRRELWSVINLITIGIAVASFFVLKIKRAEKDNKPNKSLHSDG